MKKINFYFFKKLTTPEALEEFSAAFSLHVNVKLPLTYLQQGQVYGLFNSLNQLQGGYAIITQPPFRFWNFLPEVICKKVDHQTSIIEHSVENCYEVNGVFVHDKKLSLILLKHLLESLLKVKQEILLLFYDANNSLISRLWQKKVHPITLYEGPPRLVAETENTHKKIYFGFLDKKRLENFYFRLKRVDERKNTLVKTLSHEKASLPPFFPL